MAADKKHLEYQKFVTIINEEILNNNKLIFVKETMRKSISSLKNTILKDLTTVL